VTVLLVLVAMVALQTCGPDWTATGSAHILPFAIGLDLGTPSSLPRLRLVWRPVLAARASRFMVEKRCYSAYLQYIGTTRVCQVTDEK